MPTHPSFQSRVVGFLRRAEGIVLMLIAVVLILLAVLILGNSVLILFDATIRGQLDRLATDILDNVLLVMMLMEIVYTVAVSLEERALVAEPFLIIGAIAAIRRMLIITAESAGFATLNPAAFQSTLLELGLLAFVVLIMITCVWILRRSHRLGPRSADAEEPE